MQLTEKQKSEGWRIVKFGEIAKSVSKRVDPSETELEVYVGLEHLDPDNLRITRRGVPSDVKGQKLLVKPGQIIFGKRRAYQRKVAVADFEGICSAHAMVLEAIPKAVLPEYLPFFMQSDMFMERAVSISEGSLSPTIKWKTLANQEFPLPPRKRQEEIIELMKKIDESILISKNCSDISCRLFNVAISRIGTREDKQTKAIRINELGNIYSGLSGKKGDDFKAGDSFFIPYINVFRNFKVDLNNLEKVKISQNEKQNTVLNGDVIFTISSETPHEVGMSSVLMESEFNSLYLNSFCVGFRPNRNKLDPRFSKYFFRSAYFRKKVIGLAQGSTRYNISRVALGKLSLSIPCVESQLSIANILDEFEQAYFLTLEKNKTLLNAKQKILNKIFQGAA